MRKIKTTFLLTFTLFLFTLVVNRVHAFESKITVSQLPEYINYQNFYLSYSALINDPSTIEVQFYYKEDGGIYNAFGPILTGASGQVYVDAGQVGGSDKKYYFKAGLLNEGKSVETYTTFDQNPPDAPNSYSKERINPSLYRLRWRTPNNDDFSRVFIYGGETSTFTADGSTKIGEIGGAKDTEVVWDNNVDPDKEYFYMLRAVDKAGNASGLVGDVEVITEEVQGESTFSEDETESEIVIVPVEEGAQEEKQGEVLPAKTEAPQTLGEKTTNIVQDITQFAKDRTKITLGIILGSAIVIYLIYKFFKKFFTK